jgi:hypothetical protein
MRKEKVIEELEYPEIVITKKYQDSKFEYVNKNELLIYSYLPQNINSVEVRIENSPVSKRPISTNKDKPYIRIFPGEIALIKTGLDIQVPYGYSALVETNNDMVFDKRLDVIYNQLFTSNEQTYIVVRNQSDTIKNLFHEDLLVYVKFVKNEMFNITIKEG